MVAGKNISSEFIFVDEANIMKMRFAILIPLLVFVDQVIKIIVSRFFYDPHVHFSLIDGILTFYPHQNIHLGWIPSMLDFMMPLYLLLSIVIMTLFLYCK